MKRVIIVSLVIFIGSLLIIGQAEANEPRDSKSAPTIIRVDIEGLDDSENRGGFFSRFRNLLGIRRPAPIRPEIGTTFTVQASAYASSPYQTNSQPCITAAGTRVRYGVVATNFLPMGTLLDINGEPFIVEDRMNARYGRHYIDLWFPSTSEALQFGRKNLTVTVTGYGKPGQPLSTPEPKVEEEIEDIQEDEGEVIEIILEEEESTWDMLRSWTSLMTFTLSQFIGARVNPDVNRFDVDCFNE